MLPFAARGTVSTLLVGVRRSAAMLVVPGPGLTTTRLLLRSAAVVARTRAAVATFVVAAAVTVVMLRLLAAFAVGPDLGLLRLQLRTGGTTAATAITALLSLALRALALVLLLTLVLVVVVALAVRRPRRQRDPLARTVNLEDAHFDLLADLDDLGRILDERFGELGDVHEAIVVHADIDERAERGHVRDEALEHHARLEVLHRGDVVAELRRIELRARIAAGLLELADDVTQGRLADFATDVPREVDRVDDLGIADELGEWGGDVRRHLLDEVVALRVHRRAIERVRATPDPQEPGRLLERLGTEPHDILELAARAERAVRIAVQDDLLRERLADASDVAEQLRARGVELDADVVDRALDDIAEALREQRLDDVVLVLAHADRLGLDLHELGERVLQPTSDRDRTADREVELGEFFAREVRRRVHARTGLVDRDDMHAAHADLRDRALDEALGLAPPGAVTHGDGARLVLLDERRELLLGLRELALALREVDRDRAQELTGRIDRGALAAGPQPRIDADHRCAAERCGQHEVAQIAGEDLDGRDVTSRLELAAEIVLHRRR